MARYAAVCDQINDYISLGNTNLGVAASADFCVGTFLRIPDNSGTAYKYFISNGAFGAANKFNAYVIEDSEGSGTLGGAIRIVTGDGNVSSGTDLFDWTTELCVIIERVGNDWYSWVGDSVSGMTRYFIKTDGTAIDSGGYELNRRTDGNTDRYFGGDQSRLFWGSRGVSQSEADSIASGTNPATVLGANIVANYLYDEGSGSTISDTESAATGTLNNYPTDGSQWVLIDDGGGSGFQPAWAISSNILIQGGAG